MGKTVVLTIFFLILSGVAVVVLDPDFGWHYRVGELIVTKGIVRTDPFSYTMPSYPFVDFEWGSNVLTYLGEKYFGRETLVVVWSLMVIAAFEVAIPGDKKKYWWWPVGLGLAVAITRFAIRVQVVSWLMTGIVVRIITDERLSAGRRWGFVLVMWVWANLHGSYFVGLGLWWVWWVVKMVRLRKVFWAETMIGIFGCLITLVNPYGIRNWQEVIMQTSQTGLVAATLGEWQPFWVKVDLGLVAMTAWIVVWGWRYRTKILPEELATGTIALLAGLSSLRHTVLTMIIMSPLAVKLWLELEKEVTKHPNSGKRWQIFVVGAVITAVIGFTTETTLFYWNQLRRAPNKYPEAAVVYLKKSGYPRKMLASYGWGGYLIWKLPGEKVFIDGRMPGWWWEGKPGESRHAYREYLNMILYPDLYARGVLEKYAIKTVLWRKQPKGSHSFETQAGLGFERWLVSQGWVRMYDDAVATVFVSPNEDSF